MQDQPIATITLVAGPFCGRELRIDSADVETVGLAWEGETAVYRFDAADGDWHYAPPIRKALPTGDAIFDSAVKVFGETELREMLAIVAVREAMRGDKDFWQGLAAQMNRKASEGTL